MNIDQIWENLVPLHNGKHNKISINNLSPWMETLDIISLCHVSLNPNPILNNYTTRFCILLVCKGREGGKGRRQGQSILWQMGE